MSDKLNSLHDVNVYWHRVRNASMTNGPDGPRTVVWLQGCNIRCPGCQNKALWKRDEKNKTPVETLVGLVRSLSARHRGEAGAPLTITGGEPFDQPLALSLLLYSIRVLDRSDGLPRRDIIVYTGHTWRQLWGRVAAGDDQTMLALECIDTLVDGPYMPDMDHDGIQHRGSQNQRPIDVKATITAGGLRDPDQVVVRDWGTAQMIQIIDGEIVATGSALQALGLDTLSIDVARCGEPSDA